MNAWSLESIDKSIMLDVLSVVDQASKHKEDMPYLISDFSLLKKHTVEMYLQVYQIAGEYDDAISSAMYIPDMNNPYRWTLLFDKLSMLSLNFTNFDDLVQFIRTEDSRKNKMYFLRGCLRGEQKIVPEDMIVKMVDTQNLMSISILDKTHLPQNIKFSLSTLLFNYAEYVELLIGFLSKVYVAVQEIYELFKNNYRYAAQTLKNYLNKHGADQLLDENRRKMAIESQIKKYYIILSLLRPEYMDILVEKKRIFMICGLLYVQRMLHDEQFELF